MMLRGSLAHRTADGIGGPALVRRARGSTHLSPMEQAGSIPAGRKEMDLQGILQAVSTVGFPIAACVALFWRDNKMQEQHKAESDKMTEALNNNTNALTVLTERMYPHHEEGRN